MQLRDMQGEEMDRMARERQSLADPELHQEEAEFPKTILDYFIYFYFFHLFTRRNMLYPAKFLDDHLF